MQTVDKAFAVTADLNLWFKVRANDTLMLSDVPSIISGRWVYFRDQWNFFKQQLTDKIFTYQNPAVLEQHIEDMDRFIMSQKTSPVANPFSSSDILTKYYAVFDVIEINSIPVSQEENKVIEQELTRVNKFTKTDFLQMKVIFRQARDEYSDQVGGTDATYNTIYDRSPVPELTTMSISDINVMYILHESIQTIDYVLSNIYSLETTAVDPFALAKTNANNPEIEIGSYSSGVMTRMIYGESLQSLANRTLGSPDKWIDIAIANGLKAPYIDEEGSQIPLVSTASKNIINVAGTDANGDTNINKFYINQVLYIQSDTETFQDQRTVQSIREIDISGEIIIELSGEQDLEKYTLSDNAYVRVFEPNTINSGFYILIPSSEPLSNDTKQDVPFFLRSSAEDIRQCKVDLLLTDDNDIAFTPSSDLQMQYGLDNAAQAIKLKLEVSQGSLKRHSSFGLVNVTGAKTTQIAAAKEALTQSITDQISVDPRFERIEQLNVQYVNSEQYANTVLVQLQVRLAGSSTVVPITFSVTL